jgi:hypothetical protein
MAGSRRTRRSATPAWTSLRLLGHKAFVASAWLLIGEGSLEIDRRVAEYIPELRATARTSSRSSR